ncbi:TetR/AcrR family transcriptional regulator [Amycolatopsis sp. NPDC023774]|uniref:TetR/AcrR family transcriptional regulator n=1 Tax=Amycolatopsis sp. NPDC023774 TaxID=3155015 RepID=UPI0033CEE6E7
MGNLTPGGPDEAPVTAAPVTRAERKRAERVARLERAAARVFAHHGYEGANFDLIAAELDLRGASLYYYVSSKEELFLRCLRQSAADVSARLRAIVEAEPEPRERLRRLFREQVLIEVRDYPEYVPLFFKARVSVPALADAVLGLRREHATVFEETARELGTDPRKARLCLEIAYGTLAYLPDWYDPAGAVGPVELADELAELLVAPFLGTGG